MDFITTFFGRFHPLLVHLPIGILFIAFLFECLSFRRGNKDLKKAVQPTLLWGTIFAVAAAITGFFLRQEGGYDEVIADRHQNFGIVTAVLALVVYVLRPKVKYWVDTAISRKQAKLALLVPLMLCLITTGHWGGSLTHGEQYLFAPLTGASGESKDPADAIRAISSIDQAVLYDDVIQPVFEARCYDCHSSSKQKGGLRLDGPEFIARGGESGPLFQEGPADSASLFKRLVLPPEHEDHMPPSEKPQLSSSEIALIKHWIQGDASFEKTIAEFEDQQKIAAIIRTMQQPPRRSWIPTAAVSAADEVTLDRLRGIGINLMPIGEATGYLMASFIGRQQITDEQIAGLQQVDEQLVWLNLGYSAITDRQLEAVARLRNLRVLYLNNTGVTDAGIEKLFSLTELRWLSLVGTRVSDTSGPTLSQLKNLTDLFLYQTRVTKDGVTRLTRANKEIRIDTGNYVLEKLPTDTIVYKKISSR